MEDLPEEAINLIFRFNSHQLTELIKPCIKINDGDTSRSIKLGKNKHYHSKQDYNQIQENYIQAKVIANRIRTYINEPVFNRYTNVF